MAAISNCDAVPVAGTAVCRQFSPRSPATAPPPELSPPVWRRRLRWLLDRRHHLRLCLRVRRTCPCSVVKFPSCTGGAMRPWVVMLAGHSSPRGFSRLQGAASTKTAVRCRAVWCPWGEQCCQGVPGGPFSFNNTSNSTSHNITTTNYASSSRTSSPSFCCKSNELILAATFLAVVTASYAIRCCCCRRRCFGPQHLVLLPIRWYRFPVPSATSLPDPEGAGGGSGRLSPSAPLADEERTMVPPSYDDSVRILPSPDPQLPRELPLVPESQPPRGLTRYFS
ncbi:uncharacterized protein LOC116944541 isoform X2 [Petromyzon marinus]|uniref:uncharacterized protein LOC116944541 isoform X2 n=1 Tax=Petromyzon marinus TaxID=7757 RepID=UPI003F71D307